MPKRRPEPSVDDLRRRYLDSDRPVSARVLARLRRDPRQGVRRLGAQLKARHDRRREEERRLDALLHFERLLWKSGLERVAGVDEVGVGPLAGPVVAAAVVFPAGPVVAGVDDSKRLDPERREELDGEIRQRATAVAIGVAEVAEIDRVNVYQAGLLAMRRAVEALPDAPQHVLVDAREIPGIDAPQNRFVKGDGINYSIAAASIVAKVHRDRLMVELDRDHPGYGFARHKGYSTPEHQEAIRRQGPCEIHRLSYPFLRELCGEFSERFYELRGRLTAVAAANELAWLEEELARCAGELAEEEQRKLKLTIGRRWAALSP